MNAFVEQMRQLSGIEEREIHAEKILMDTGRQQQLLMYARGLAGIMPDS